MASRPRPRRCWPAGPPSTAPRPRTSASASPAASRSRTRTSCGRRSPDGRAGRRLPRRLSDRLDRPHHHARPGPDADRPQHARPRARGGPRDRVRAPGRRLGPRRRGGPRALRPAPGLPDGLHRGQGRGRALPRLPRGAHDPRVIRAGRGGGGRALRPGGARHALALHPGGRLGHAQPEARGLLPDLPGAVRRPRQPPVGEPARARARLHPARRRVAVDLGVDARPARRHAPAAGRAALDGAVGGRRARRPGRPARARPPVAGGPPPSGTAQPRAARCRQRGCGRAPRYRNRPPCSRMPPLFITLILTTALLLVVVVARRNGSVRGALARDVRPRGERGPSPAQMDAERRLRPRIAAPLAGEDALTDPPEGDASGPAPIASDTEERPAGGQDTVVWSWPEAGAVIDAPGWPAPGELGAADEPRAEGEDAAGPAVA